MLKTSGEATIRIGAAFITAATLAVVLRLITKSKTKAALLPEDWLSMIALLFFYAYEAVLIRSTSTVQGQHKALTLDRCPQPVRRIFLGSKPADILSIVLFSTGIDLAQESSSRSLFVRSICTQQRSYSPSPLHQSSSPSCSSTEPFSQHRAFAAQPLLLASFVCYGSLFSYLSQFSSVTLLRQPGMCYW